MARVSHAQAAVPSPPASEARPSGVHRRSQVHPSQCSRTSVRRSIAAQHLAGDPAIPPPAVPERPHGSPRRVSLNVYRAEEVPLHAGESGPAAIRRHSIEDREAAAAAAAEAAAAHRGPSPTGERFYPKTARTVVIGAGEDVYDVQKLRRSPAPSQTSRSSSSPDSSPTRRSHGKAGYHRPLSRGRDSKVHEPMMRLNTTKAQVMDSRHLPGRSEERRTYTIPSSRKALPVVLYKDPPGGGRRKGAPRLPAAARSPAADGSPGGRSRRKKAQRGDDDAPPEAHARADSETQTESQFDLGVNSVCLELLTSEEQTRRFYKVQEQGDRLGLKERFRGALPLFAAHAAIIRDLRRAERAGRLMQRDIEVRAREILRAQLEHAILAATTAASQDPVLAELTELREQAAALAEQLASGGDF
eukprot:TRINITY_DN50873_c0_g1_i1.p1 TRINITY_DN50873_c0_g1~~TRINITY_DN50873_c0_g1_i1.p1  ORF type:complete len:446 (+),score=123.28 TRINITY_DN50873_c0_g1_i1:92-1339(+)